MVLSTAVVSERGNDAATAGADGGAKTGVSREFCVSCPAAQDRESRIAVSASLINVFGGQICSPAAIFYRFAEFGPGWSVF